MTESWIVKWYEVLDGGYCRWFFRKIVKDGSFYGETERLQSNIPRQTSIEGKMSKADIEHLTSLAEEIENAVCTGEISDTKEGWTGLFALGPINNPSVLVRYRANDETKSHTAELFLEVIEVLRPYTAEASKYIDNQ